MQAFEDVDWNAPLDVNAVLRAVPGDATIRGFLTSKLVHQVKKRGVTLGRARYVDFRSYPLREHIEILAQAAPLLHPHVPPREALRRMGMGALPAFGETTAGRVLLSLSAESKGERAFGLLTRGYAMTRSLGGATLREIESNRAVVELRDIHDFPDAVHVGIFEDLLRGYGHSGRVRVRRLGLSDVDLELILDGR